MSRRFAALIVHVGVEALGELVELLKSPDLKVDTARSATEAIRKLESRAYQVIISGHKPPLLDGVALLNASAEHCPDALHVLVATYPSDAVELDHRPDPVSPIVRFVGRAGERSRLVALVAESMKLMRLIDAQRDLVHKLSSDHEKLSRREKLLDVVVLERTKKLEESYLLLKAANRQALFGLAEAIEAKDPYTKGHCGRVAAYSLVLAQECGYPDDGLETLEFGAFLHDIGKIGVRDSVLLKPGPLDEDEWEHMRLHPSKGSDIAAQIEMLKPIMPAVRNHHERWDGLGYPDRMKGEDIPLPARIVSIADAYDAMATDRPYKKALPLEECEALLRKNAGKMFAPDLVEVFCKHHLGAILRDDFAVGSGAEPSPSEVDAADAAEVAAAAAEASASAAALPRAEGTTPRVALKPG